ncbi:exonuclease domain-containing protein [uncultured Croceitalea sp.]|uniref:exonuclease domain-containing protein n=1 Tax=uncultured Croceitalea sp. TaxID=1798908 RepID=UPI00330587DF
MYAILDIESTGGKYNEEGIMEIAIHRFDGHKVVDKFISLINPERDIQPFVVNLTGINNKMLVTAPKFHEVAKRIIEITEGAVLVAHNAQFDYRILRTEFRRLGYDFQRRSLCTVDLSKKLIPEAESHSLGKLVRSLGIAVSDRHRANGDALATLKLFKLLLNKDSSKTIITEVIREETQGELSTKQLDMVDALPSETGVYYMHDKNGKVLFIGKSKNIKKRVNQHFTNIGALARKLQKETKKVTFEKTGSELVALLKEHHEIKKNSPIYNDKRKRKGFSYGIYVFENKAGNLTLKPERANGQAKRLGSFNSMRATQNFLIKVSKEFELSEELNGTIQNEKVLDALDKYSIDNRNVVVLDRGRELGEQSAILVKDGILNGVGFIELNYQLNNIHILESIITPMQGDAHSTYIIEAYLRKSKRIKIVALD